MEVLVASSIAILLVAVTLMLLLQSAREGRRGFADATVEEAVAGLQSQLLAHLRVTSATEGVIFAGPSSIIFARGPAPDYPREQITFNSGTGQVLYYVNRTMLANPLVLHQNRTNVTLRQLGFSPSIKPDGTTNCALINVIINMDDNGSAGRRGSGNPASVWRTFSIEMRNS